MRRSDSDVDGGVRGDIYYISIRTRSRSLAEGGETSPSAFVELVTPNPAATVAGSTDKNVYCFLNLFLFCFRRRLLGKKIKWCGSLAGSCHEGVNERKRYGATRLCGVPIAGARGRWANTVICHFPSLYCTI